MKTLLQYISEAFRLRDDTKIIVPHVKKDELTPDVANALRVEDIEKSEYADKFCDRRFENSKIKIRFRSDGRPPLYIQWWIALCIYGPMKKQELLRHFGLNETSYGTAFTDYTRKGIFGKGPHWTLEPRPMSEWEGYFK